MTRLTKQRQVLDGLDALGGRTWRRMARGYRSITGPIVKAIETAEMTGDDEADNRRLLASLGSAVFMAMDTADIEHPLGDALALAGMIGVVSAEPRAAKKGTADERG